MILEPTHLLCRELHTRLTSLENNFALMEMALRELNAMWTELFSVREHMSQLSQSLYTIPIQLRTLIKRVDNMEEQLEHVHDALRQDLDQPTRLCDSD